MENREIEIVDGKAQVTKTTTEVLVFELSEVENELAVIQQDIDKMELKKQRLQDIIAAFNT